MRATLILAVFLAGLSSPARSVCVCRCDEDGKIVALCGKFDLNHCYQEMCSIKPKPFHSAVERPAAPYLGPPPATAPKPEPPPDK